jgi:hypothetical protein
MAGRKFAIGYNIVHRSPLDVIDIGVSPIELAESVIKKICSAEFRPFIAEHRQHDATTRR